MTTEARAKGGTRRKRITSRETARTGSSDEVGPPASKASAPRGVLVLQGGGALGSYQAGVLRSDAASQITGANISADGGWTAE